MNNALSILGFKAVFIKKFINTKEHFEIFKHLTIIEIDWNKANKISRHYTYKLLQIRFTSRKKETMHKNLKIPKHSYQFVNILKLFTSKTYEIS